VDLGGSALRKLARKLEEATIVTESDDENSCRLSLRRRDALLAKHIEKRRHHLYALKAMAMNEDQFALVMAQEEARILSGARLLPDDRDFLDTVQANVRRCHILAFECSDPSTPAVHRRRSVLAFQNALDGFVTECTVASIFDDRHARRVRKEIAKEIRENRRKERSKDDYCCDIDLACRTASKTGVFQGGRGGRPVASPSDAGRKQQPPRPQGPSPSPAPNQPPTRNNRPQAPGPAGAGVQPPPGWKPGDPWPF